MKKKLIIVFVLIFCMTMLMPLCAYATNPIINSNDSNKVEINEQIVDELMLQYTKALASGEEYLPSIEWVKETQRIYQESINTGQQIKPTDKWLELSEAQYEVDMEKIRKEINEAGIETDGSISISAIADVKAGTAATFNQADCGNKGKSEYCDDYEAGGNFRADWGTDSYGWADALSENFTLINVHSATTWAWVGKQIKVKGTGNARIYFNGDYAYNLLGGMEYPTYAKCTIKAIVYNVTDSKEVSSKSIVNASNFAPLPNYGDDSFSEYIDCSLVDGKTYALRMEATAYISAGSECSADLCSNPTNPAAGREGIDYTQIKVTWK